jgi:hypothetical protein
MLGGTYMRQKGQIRMTTLNLPSYKHLTTQKGKGASRDAIHAGRHVAPSKHCAKHEAALTFVRCFLLLPPRHDPLSLLIILTSKPEAIEFQCPGSRIHTHEGAGRAPNL